MKTKMMYIVIGLTVLMARPVVAAVHTVTSAADDGGSGTLRYIVETASVAGDRVVFAPGVNSITLGGTQITIAKALSIEGAGAVTLNGNAQSRIFRINNSSAVVALTGLAFTDGVASGENGGAILVDTALDVGITNCVFTGCSAANGGAVYNVRKMTLSNCRMTGNIAIAEGGGLYSKEGHLVAIVGGLYGGNTAGGKGGGIRIYHWAASWLEMSGGTVISNNTSSAGGGLYLENAKGFIQDATFADNVTTDGGGGLQGVAAKDLFFVLEGCTFLRNQCRYGGGGSSIAGNNTGRWIILDTLFRGNMTTSAENWQSGAGVSIGKTVAAFTNCVFEVNGNTSGNGYGSAVFARKALAADSAKTLFNGCSFAGNYANGSGGVGGALWFNDDAFLENCTFVTNFSARFGGAIYTIAGTQIYKDSKFLNNSAVIAGGAIHFFEYAQPNVIGCDFSGNYTTGTDASAYISEGYGGAISLCSSSNSVVSNCVFKSNVSSRFGGGAIGTYTMAPPPSLYCYSSQFEGNIGFDGGAIKLRYPGQIYDCTFITNSSTGTTGGGAVIVWACNDNLASLFANSTFVGNTAVNAGGAIAGWEQSPSQPALQVHNSTFVGNFGKGAIALQRNNALTSLNSISSSILWANMEGTVPNDLHGGFSNVVYCIVGEPASGYTVGESSEGTVNGIDPKLEPLAYNGGPTLYGDSQLLTMALRRRSPAIDMGSNPLSLAFDQRGEGFTREYETGMPDIGAFEYIPPPPMQTVIVVR